MSRAQQDQLIDDEESECCPLCVEEFDLSDRNFRPCPCGYQICQFCYNNIKTTMNGLCPACRRQYDDKNIEWKVISSEEMATYKADLAQQAKKKAAARQKEAQKREADSQSRKHLAGLRVVQKNLVYVTGLSPNIREDKLLQTLRGEQYFGQYGRINKIVVSKAKDPSHANQSVGVYVTFARKQDAATCIAAVDGSLNGDRMLRAQYGTTKYCSAYLRGETCMNRNCMFLHEPGEESESFTRQDLSSMNVISTQQPTNIHLPVSDTGPNRNINQTTSHQPNPSHATSQPMDKQDSMESAASANEAAVDIPALPSTANWANKASLSQEEARGSIGLSASKDSLKTKTSPEPSNIVSANTENGTGTNTTGGLNSKTAKSLKSKTPFDKQTSDAGIGEIVESSAPHLDKIMKSLSSSHLEFLFAASKLDPAERAVIENFPALFDVNSGCVERMRRAKNNDYLQKQEPDVHEIMALGTASLDEHNPESGSLQLGGEPEERQNALYGRDLQRLIQPPSEIGQGDIGVNNTNNPFALTGDFANISLNNRAPTNQMQQLQQQQKQNYMQQLRPAMTAISSFESLQNSQAQSIPASLFNPGSGPTGHTRQASRYTFANDSASASVSVKPVSNAKFMSQQSSLVSQGSSSQLASTPTQPGFGSQLYTNSMQGPQPGLKASGMPVNNGAMFGQGHAFTNGSVNYGTNPAGRNSNEDMVRELLRTRSGVHSSQIPDIGKHDEFPPLISPEVPEPCLKPPFDDRDRRDPGLMDEVSQAAIKYSASSSQPPWLWNPPSEDSTFIAEQTQKRTLLSPAAPLAGLGADLRTEQTNKSQPVAGSELVKRSPHGTISDRESKPAKKTKNHSELLEKSSQGRNPEQLGNPLGTLKGKVTKEDKKRTDTTQIKAEGVPKPTGWATMAKSVISELSTSQKHKKSEKVVSETDFTNKKTKKENVTVSADGKADRVPKEPCAVSEAVQTSVASPKRQIQPKTLRVLPPTKAENIVESSSNMSWNDSAQMSNGKISSRQGSVISVNLPGTPHGEMTSDQTSVTSTSISRPNSPQTNIEQTQIPVRPNAKKRKARQERANQSTIDVDSGVADKTKSPNEEPTPVPILGRKKKSKKSSSVTPSQTSAAAILSDVETKMQPKSSVGETKHELEKDVSQDISGSTPVEPSSHKPPQTAASMISSLQATSNIIVSALEFFKPASGLNYRHELTQTDLPNRDRRIQLSDEDIAKLNNHETVRLSGDDDRNSSRALISPLGACLRGLSKEQEDRFLELEAKVSNDKAPTKYLSNKISTLENAFPVISPTTETVVPPQTATQLKANDEVLAYNDQFVLQPAVQGHPSDRRVPNDASTVLGLKLHKPGEIALSLLGGAENNLVPTSLIPSGAGKHASATGMAPLLTVDEAEAAVSRSRKETEALEKKLNALIKKNRRLAFSSA